MAQISTAIQAWGFYLAARVAATAIDCFDITDRLAYARMLARQIGRLDARHRRRAEANLRMALPEWTEGQVQQTAVASFEHLAALAIEALATPRVISAGSWTSRVTIGRLGEALRILNAGSPAIMVTGHVGNFELLGYFMALMGYRIDAIARPFDNPLIYDWLLGVRERHGMRIITKWDASDRMIEVLDSGGVLGFIADQNAGDKGLFVPFFGRLASHYKSIGLLAMHKRVPVICGVARRIGVDYRYEIDVFDIIQPEDWEGRDDQLFYITARYARAIEMMVRRCPEQYFWMHRRWKSRPRHEREGKPMPAALRKSLESLPWMDDATLARLDEPIASPA